jgi:prephenate dehydrogenase
VTTGVAGLGLIGGSILRGLADAIGYDADPGVRAAADAEGFAVTADLAGLAACELVIVAVPPARTPDVVREVLKAAPEAAVADTASVKGPVVRELGERFVGAHPLAGAETSGWAASAPEVVGGAVWAVCPADAALEPLCRLSDAVDRLDGRLLACTPEEHDAAVARTSHLPHVVAAALAGVAGDPLRAALSGNSLRDMTRVARADPALWADILAANREQAMAALDDFEAGMAGLRVALAGGDREVLATVWSRAGDALGVLDAIRWEAPTWENGVIEGGWDGLLALGREGRAVRRLSLEGGVLRADIGCRVRAAGRPQVDNERREAP